MNDWRIDDDGSLRTPAGMKVGVVTRDGEFRVADRVIHAEAAITLWTLLRLWWRWQSGR